MERGMNAATDGVHSGEFGNDAWEFYLPSSSPKSWQLRSVHAIQDNPFSHPCLFLFSPRTTSNQCCSYCNQQAVCFVCFLVGFITVLCIGNYFRAKRAQERQRQRRLAKLASSNNNGGAQFDPNYSGTYEAPLPQDDGNGGVVA